MKHFAAIYDNLWLIFLPSPFLPSDFWPSPFLPSPLGFHWTNVTQVVLDGLPMMGWQCSRSGVNSVGACLATGDRIFATGIDSASKIACSPVAVFAWFQGMQSWIERAPAAQDMHSDNSSFASLSFTLSGPLNRLNAIPCLLHPLDRYRTPSAIGSAIGRPLSRPISHPNTGWSPQPPRSKPLGGAQPRDSGAIVSKTPLKPEYPEYVVHIFCLKYCGTPKYGNMLGNPLPVGPAQQTTEIT